MQFTAILLTTLAALAAASPVANASGEKAVIAGETTITAVAAIELKTSGVSITGLRRRLGDKRGNIEERAEELWPFDVLSGNDKDDKEGGKGGSKDDGIDRDAEGNIPDDCDLFKCGSLAATFSSVITCALPLFGALGGMDKFEIGGCISPWIGGLQAVCPCLPCNKKIKDLMAGRGCPKDKPQPKAGPTAISVIVTMQGLATPAPPQKTVTLLPSLKGVGSTAASTMPVSTQQSAPAGPSTVPQPTSSAKLSLTTSTTAKTSHWSPSSSSSSTTVQSSWATHPSVSYSTLTSLSTILVTSSRFETVSSSSFIEHPAPSPGSTTTQTTWMTHTIGASPKATVMTSVDTVPTVMTSVSTFTTVVALTRHVKAPARGAPRGKRFVLVTITTLTSYQPTVMVIPTATA